MFINANNLKIVKTAQVGNKGTFVVEPLPQTFGATIGNSLRRVLMTSIKGSAATQMKIAGANHQFTTIEGVKEDIVEISLNIKQIRFKVHGDNPQIIVLEKKGKGPVTAADFTENSNIEVLNKSVSFNLHPLL